MDIETIKQQIAKGGYASLTTAQKEIYHSSLSLPTQTPVNAPTPPITPLNPPADTSSPLPSGSGNNLLDYKNTLSQVVQLARDKRNELMLKFMGTVAPVGTMNASDFSSILSNLNAASDKTTEETIKNVIPEPPTIKSEMKGSDKEGWTMITYDDTGKIYGTKKVIGGTGTTNVNNVFDLTEGGTIDLTSVAGLKTAVNHYRNKYGVDKPYSDWYNYLDQKTDLGATGISKLMKEAGIVETTPETAPITLEDVKKELKNVLTPMKDTYTRDEAKSAAESQLKSALGMIDADELPKAYKDAIEDALVEVYGRTFWQKVIPGGR